MATESFDISISGADRLASSLRTLSDLMVKPRAVLLAVGNKMKEQALETFRRQRDPVTGAPWLKTGGLALMTRPGGGGSGKTLSDTGLLLQSIMSRAPKVIGGDSVAIEARRPYAAMHQYGEKNLKPRSAKMLALPLTRQARRSGSARRWWKQNESKKPFIFTSQRGNSFIATADPRTRALTLAFILKESVKIPQRRYLGLGLGHKLEIEYLIIGMAERRIREITGGGASR